MMITSARGQCSKDQKVAIGVDVGGTKILVGYVTEDGHVLESRQYSMDRTSQLSALRSIDEAIDHFLQLFGDGPPAEGIGIGLVGHIDPEAGVWKHAINIPIHEPIHLSEKMEKRYGLPVTLDNDVRCATRAELLYGAGQEFKHFIYLNLGTGISMGIVSDGRLVRGAANYAGELGHMSVNTVGPRCSCGRIGCMETMASGGGMILRAMDLLSSYPQSTLNQYASRLQTDRIFIEALQGDLLAARIRNEALGALQISLTNVVNLLNPEAIIVGGGVSRDKSIVDDLEAHLRTTALPPAANALVCIEQSKLEVGRVGLVGAASLVWGGGINETHR
ncbi:ROK family protein [Paenibacillus solani]|nr:ROK family protein [Paenibacillus solani]